MKINEALDVLKESGVALDEIILLPYDKYLESGINTVKVETSQYVTNIYGELGGYKFMAITTDHNLEFDYLMY